MSNDLTKYSEQVFEDIKHINEYGQEFWYARELQAVLEYTEWRNFYKWNNTMNPKQYMILSICKWVLSLPIN